MDSAYEMVKTKHDVTAISLEIWSGTSKLAREITSECKKIKPTKEEMTCNYMLRDYGKLVDMIRVGYKLPKHIALVVAMVSIPHLSKDINMNNVCCACRSIAYTGLEFNINSKGLKSEGDVPLEQDKTRG